MTVTDVRKDLEALTMTIAAEFDAPAERVWQMWADPRQLEQWWGPPTYPATFEEHELSPGGVASYYMTGPDGDRHRGWWRVLDVEAPRNLAFEDGFADESGAPIPDMPAMIGHVALSDRPEGGTHMAIRTTFPSLEAMEQVIAMGMEEGMVAALGQIDGLLLAVA